MALIGVPVVLGGLVTMALLSAVYLLWLPFRTDVVSGKGPAPVKKGSGVWDREIDGRP